MGADGFLIDEDLPVFIAPALRRLGLNAHDSREVGLCGKPDAELAAFALERRLAILTGDFDFANVREYPPDRYQGIVVLEFPNHWNAVAITRLAVEFASRGDLLSLIPGCLAIVAPGRVRMWPP